MIEFTAKIRATYPLTVETPLDIASALHDLAERHDYVTIRVSAPRKPRTTGYRSQNHRLNGFIQQICVATGNDFGAVKDVVKLRAISRGYPFTTFKGITVPQSEADCSTIECGLLIDEVEALAAEEGIVLREYEEEL